MPTQVCDRSPCDYMRAAIGFILKPNTKGDKFELLAKALPLEQTMIVSLKYCPFCGTRIDEQWVEEVKKRW